MPRQKKVRSLAAVVLAAGKGKRLRSSVPKVLHPLCGRPLLWHAVQTALAAKPDRLVIVVSNGALQVREAVLSWGLRPEPVFVDQGEPLGTGHAVLAAEAAEVADPAVVAGPGVGRAGRFSGERDTTAASFRSGTRPMRYEWNFLPAKP